MKNKKTVPGTDLFSNDPDENLRIENEFLHLKLKAELGGELVGDLPLSPELENKFIKNILEFEHAYANTTQVKIFDFLGQPSFTKADELDDQQIETALPELFELLSKKNIELGFSGEYEARLKYKFITEELFFHETDDIQIPGFVTHYIYEEFHPNHKTDLESRAIEFIQGWLDKDIDENNWELADAFILPDKKVFSKKEVLDKIKMVFDSHSEYENANYSFADINFETAPDDSKGYGFVEGFISYQAILENKERVMIDGPFKLYFSLEHKWWSIFYFVFPGFNW